MTKRKGANRKETWAAIRRASIKLLHERGYHATNMRVLAQEANLTPAALYNYFDNKDELLANIVIGIVEELNTQVSRAIEKADGPEQKLDVLVSEFVSWHTKRKKEGQIAHSQMQYLSRKDYAKAASLRKEFEAILQRIINEGIAAGVFNVADAQTTSVAILNMLVSIASWYKPRGRLSVDELSQRYRNMASLLVGAGSSKAVEN